MAAASDVRRRGVRKRRVDRQRLGRAVGGRQLPRRLDRRMPRQRRAVVDVAQAAQIDRAPVRRLLQRRPLVRPREGHGHPLRLHQLERLLGLERGLQHDRSAGREGAADHHGEVARPEEAVGRPAADVVPHAHQARPAPPLDRDRPLGMEDALGLAGRSGREEQRPDVRGRHRRRPGRDQRRRRRAATAEEVGPALDRARSADCLRRLDHHEAAQEREAGRLAAARARRSGSQARARRGWRRSPSSRSCRSKSRIETLDAPSRCSSSGGVENVLSGTITPPASAVPNAAARCSGRFVIRMPTRLSLPTPQAMSARATSSERSHKVA